MATQSVQRYLTAAEFLQIDFGPDLKAELNNGVIEMMAGGSLEHARTQANLLRWFGTVLRGSGCRPYGSDAGVQTRASSIRYPDLTIDCGEDGGPEVEAERLVLRSPRMVVEVLSPRTRADDEGIKLEEYRGIESLQLILLIDPLPKRLRLLERNVTGEWDEHHYAGPVDLSLRPFGLTLPHAEIFARD